MIRWALRRTLDKIECNHDAGHIRDMIAFDYVTCHGRRVSPYLRKGLVQRGRKKAGALRHIGKRGSRARRSS